MLTTWNTQCGIAEYSRYLVEALHRAGENVTVLGSRNYDERKVQEDEDYVIPVFDVLPWNRYGLHGLDVDVILEQDFDVLHVQYESLLYHQGGLVNLLESFKGLKVITYHDNCIHPNFPYYLFDLRYTHREDVGVGEGFILPMGVENRQPVVKTFGLGRSREDLILETCLRLDFRFEKSFGETTWQPTHVLYEWLRDADAIVLYYDEVPSAGSSIAARVAISTRRPVFISDTTWFAELHEGSELPNVRKFTNREDLETKLQALKIPYTEENSWDKIAVYHMDDYRRYHTKCVLRSQAEQDL